VKYLGKSHGEATWEPSECIPLAIIESYQKHQETVIVSVDDNYSGQISRKLKLVSQGENSMEPPEKKPKSTNGEIPEEG